MTLGHFAMELKKLHPEFQVIKGKVDDLTAGVFFKGERLFTIPGDEIYEHPIDTYGVDVHEGLFIRHRTSTEAMQMAKKVLRDMREGGVEYRATMGLGEFSDESLRPGNEAQELADEQAYEAKQKETNGGILIP